MKKTRSHLKEVKIHVSNFGRLAKKPEILVGRPFIFEDPVILSLVSELFGCNWAYAMLCQELVPPKGWAVKVHRRFLVRLCRQQGALRFGSDGIFGCRSKTPAKKMGALESEMKVLVGPGFVLFPWKSQHHH